MRQKKRIFIVSATLIITLLLWLKANSQEISKVSEIYDYEIGDIFHFKNTGSYGSSGMVEYININIIDKYYSFNNDTLFYIQDVTGYYIQFQPDSTIYFSYTDTVKYYNLDLEINNGYIDTVYIDPSLFNGRKINYHSYYLPYELDQYEFVDGCGRAYYFYKYGEPPFPETEYKSILIYFLKGEEEWGEPYYVKIPEVQRESSLITIYPNPARDCIKIKIFPLIKNEVGIYLYSTDGRLVETYFGKLNQDSQFDISNLANGIYSISIKSKDKIFHSRFIKY